MQARRASRPSSRPRTGGYSLIKGRESWPWGTEFNIPQLSKSRCQGQAVPIWRRELLVPLPGRNPYPWGCQVIFPFSLPHPISPRLLADSSVSTPAALGQNVRPTQFCLAGISGTALCPQAAPAVWVSFGPCSATASRVWAMCESWSGGKVWGSGCLRPSCETVGKSLLSGPQLP